MALYMAATGALAFRRRDDERPWIDAGSLLAVPTFLALVLLLYCLVQVSLAPRTLSRAKAPET